MSELTDYAARAGELMTLALGVGISNNQSQALIATQLREWDGAWKIIADRKTAIIAYQRDEIDRLTDQLKGSK